MKPLTQSVLRKFLKIAGDKLSGEWIIVGGTVLPLLGVDLRQTIDIDLASKGKTSNSEQLVLMEIAERLGYPVETINTAAEYFLKKVPKWDEMLVLLHEGKKCRFYRPSATLFILLKVNRLSESDLSDCLAMIDWAKTHPEELDRKKLTKIMAMDVPNVKEQKTRLQTLQLRIARAIKE